MFHIGVTIIKLVEIGELVFDRARLALALTLQLVTSSSCSFGATALGLLQQTVPTISVLSFPTPLTVAHLLQIRLHMLQLTAGISVVKDFTHSTLIYSIFLAGDSFLTVKILRFFFSAIGFVTIDLFFYGVRGVSPPTCRRI